MRLRAILDDFQAVSQCDPEDWIDVGRLTVEMHGHDRLGSGSQQWFDPARVHREIPGLDVRQHGSRARHFDRGDGRHGGVEDPSPPPLSPSGPKPPRDPLRALPGDEVPHRAAVHVLGPDVEDLHPVPGDHPTDGRHGEAERVLVVDLVVGAHLKDDPKVRVLEEEHAGGGKKTSDLRQEGVQVRDVADDVRPEDRVGLPVLPVSARLSTAVPTESGSHEM